MSDQPDPSASIFALVPDHLPGSDAFRFVSVPAETRDGSTVQVSLRVCASCESPAFIGFKVGHPYRHSHMQCANCQRVTCLLRTACSGVPQVVVRVV